MKSGRSKIRPEFLLRSYLLVSSQLRGGYTSLKSALTSATVAVGLIIRKSKKLAVLYALSSREGCDTGRGAWLKSLELGWRETADPKTFPAALPVPPSRDRSDGLKSSSVPVFPGKNRNRSGDWFPNRGGKRIDGFSGSVVSLAFYNFEGRWRAKTRWLIYVEYYVDLVSSCPGSTREESNRTTEPFCFAMKTVSARWI